MPYHWNSFIHQRRRINGGMSRTAPEISNKVARIPVARSRSACDSASLNGNSGVERTDHQTVENEKTAPIKKATIVICGMLWLLVALRSMPSHTRMLGVR